MAPYCSATGTSVLLEGVGGFTTFPLHNIQLCSDLVSGSVIVGVKPTLPVEGVSLLLGNDIARVKVMNSLVMSVKPVKQEDNNYSSLRKYVSWNVSSLSSHSCHGQQDVPGVT